MNKAGLVLGAVIIIVAIVAGAYIIAHNYHTRPWPSDTAPAQTGTGNAAVGATGASSIVTYADKGFSPSPLSIVVGTTVTWVNNSSRMMWIETTGPGGGSCSSVQGATAPLNECHAVSSGGTYSYTFTTLGTFAYFNHERSSDTGIIVVSDVSSAGPINSNAVPE